MGNIDTRWGGPMWDEAWTGGLGPGGGGAPRFADLGSEMVGMGAVGWAVVGDGCKR